MLVNKEFNIYNYYGRRKFMKKHNAIKVVLICLGIFLLLSWIFPAAYFQTSFVSQGRVQMGLFDIFNYPVVALQYFGYIVLYVLVVGAFYGVLNKISAYRVALDKIVSKFKDHKKLFLSVIMIILAVLTSVCGVQLALFIVIPFVVSLVLLMGYDKIVALLTTVGSISVGLMGSTYAYSNLNILSQYLSLGMGTQIITRLIILVIGLGVLIFYTMHYIKNTKKFSVSDADLKYYIPEEVKKADSKKVNVWPLRIVSIIMLVIMVLAFISWSGAFNITAFDDATTAVTGFKLFGFPIFSKILGTVSSFGNWTLTSYIVVIAVATLVLAIAYKISFDDIMQDSIKGIKNALAPAVVVLLIYTGLVIVTYHPFQLTIFKGILGLTKGFNVFTSTIVAILASIFNVDPLYVFNSVVPYLVSIVSDKTVYSVIWVIFQSIYGLSVIIAPTSVVLLATLSYLNVSYKKWAKFIWKFALTMLIILLVLFTILVIL